MKRDSMARRSIGILLLLLALSFWGCKKASGPSGPESPPGQGGKVDRYKELVQPPPKGRLTIYFLHLSVTPQAVDKSGDAMLVILPNGKVMMVDSGHPESSSDSLGFLSDLGIGKIDYFIITHPHIDHVGGFPAIAEKHEIGEVFQTDMKYPTAPYRAFQEAVASRRIPVHLVKRGDTLRFGDEVTAKVFNPPGDFNYPPNFPDNSTQFVNDNSLVIKFTWGKSSILLGADIYLTRERELADLYGDELKALVIKANHHGNDTSNGPRWIKTVQPKVAAAMNDLVSSMAVYSNYKKSGAAFYNTSLDGQVRVSLDKEGNYSVISRFDSWLRE
ncbi:MAG: MBL fold metallo-hydrolase [Treponema sp.]|nr:MBL fold metallo-hydrolase [Treponema sp.]